MSEELKFHQVAYVVKDLDKAVKHWADDLGIGPWTVYTLKSPGLKNCVYKGQATDFGIRHAMAFSGNLQFELVEPLHGPSIFRDQLFQPSNLSKLLVIFSSILSLKDAIRKPSSSFMVSCEAVTSK